MFTYAVFSRRRHKFNHFNVISRRTGIVSTCHG